MESTKRIIKQSILYNMHVFGEDVSNTGGLHEGYKIFLSHYGMAGG